MAGKKFDPKAYLAEDTKPAVGFDPRAYLGEDAPAETATATAPTDLGPLVTGALHGTRHLAYGLGDKITAGVHALYDTAHNKAKPFTLANLADAYSRDLAFNDAALESSDQLNPAARWTGNALGAVGSMLVPAGVGRLAAAGNLGRVAQAANTIGAAGPLTLTQMARGGAKAGAALGGFGGFGGSRSDSLGGTALDTGMGLITGTALGYAAPYAGALLGRGASYLGDKASDLAGWLKVHSLHPTPRVGEAMADLPGGEEGVGKELLARGIGKLTAKGTSKQLKAETSTAGAAIDAVAKAHDAAGGAPMDLGPALDEAIAHANELQARPATEAAGERLGTMLEKYRDMYAGKPVSAAEALSLKRELGKLAYGAGKQFDKSGDTVAGDFGAGMSKAERAVDDTLDETLGPAFGDANTAFRRLLGASQAAKRLAGRTQTNHLVSLLPLVAGGAGAAAHGAEGGLMAAAATHLFNKYGSQAGARGLYTLGQLTSGLGSALPRAAPYASVASQQINPYAEALLASLRRQSSAEPPALAMEKP